VTRASLHPVEVGCVAGLIDGEGTVTLTRVHRNEFRRLVVSISNNDLAVLQYVRDTVGAGRINRKRAYSPRHAPSFTYQLSSRQALALLHLIAPYLRTYKVARARLALIEYIAVTPRNGKYGPKLLARRADFEARFLAIRP